MNTTSTAEKKLAAIAAELAAGTVPKRVPVRTFLEWFGAQRRGSHVVNRIYSALERHGLGTFPDIDYAWFHGSVDFVDPRTKSNTKGASKSNPTLDPTMRIERLDAANRSPVTIAPTATLEKAVSVMHANDFSQLPVVTTPREIKGMITWKSIGSRLALGLECTTVSDCVDPVEVVSIQDSLLGTIARFGKHDVLVVLAVDKSISGIITRSDISDQFQGLAEPFLLIGEIETGVRRLLHGKMSLEDLKGAKNPEDTSRTIESINDLTLGETVRLLEGKGAWGKVALKVDRVDFTSGLKEICEIRNDVMHFDPDGLSGPDLQVLRDFARFMKQLRDHGAM